MPANTLTVYHFVSCVSILFITLQSELFTFKQYFHNKPLPLKPCFNTPAHSLHKLLCNRKSKPARWYAPRFISLVKALKHLVHVYIIRIFTSLKPKYGQSYFWNTLVIWSPAIARILLPHLYADALLPMHQRIFITFWNTRLSACTFAVINIVSSHISSDGSMPCFSTPHNTKTLSALKVCWHSN